MNVPVGTFNRLRQDIEKSSLIYHFMAVIERSDAPIAILARSIMASPFHLLHSWFWDADEEDAGLGVGDGDRDVPGDIGEGGAS